MIFPVIFLLLFLFFGIGSIFWMWMIIDCAMNEPSQGNDKIVWILIVFLGHFAGALVYFFVRRPERIRLYGK